MGVGIGFESVGCGCSSLKQHAETMDAYDLNEAIADLESQLVESIGSDGRPVVKPPTTIQAQLLEMYKRELAAREAGKARTWTFEEQRRFWSGISAVLGAGIGYAAVHIIRGRRNLEQRTEGNDAWRYEQLFWLAAGAAVGAWLMPVRPV